MTIVVKKVPKCLRGIVKLLFGIKEKWYEKKGYSYSLYFRFVYLFIITHKLSSSNFSRT